MRKKQIELIRQTTREIVTHLGYLNNLFSHIGSVSQCYALTQLEKQPLTILGLSEKLDLEHSSVSRLAKVLVNKGYCEYINNEDDGRSRFLQLTDLGKLQLKEIHQQATIQVKQALSHLSLKEQDIVTEGLALYAKALKSTSEDK